MIDRSLLSLTFCNRWLFECARTGRRVDVGKYLIDDFPDEPNGKYFF